MWISFNCLSPRTVSVPPNSGLEGGERLALELGEEGREAGHLALALTDMLEPLVRYCCEGGRQEGDNPRRKKVLIGFMLSLLGRPLSHLSQHPEVDIFTGS